VGKLNAFVSSLKARRRGSRPQPQTARESAAEYAINEQSDAPASLFTNEDLEWLQATPNT
jgi:hypothetical protein